MCRPRWSRAKAAERLTAFPYAAATALVDLKLASDVVVSVAVGSPISVAYAHPATAGVPEVDATKRLTTAEPSGC